MNWAGNHPEALAEIAWLRENSERRSHAVGELKANPFGLFDIIGNVFEWVQDGWTPTSYAAPQSKNSLNPFYPSNETGMHGFRGGDWEALTPGSRSAYRHAHPAETKGHSIGMRLVLPVESVRQWHLTHAQKAYAARDRIVLAELVGSMQKEAWISPLDARKVAHLNKLLSPDPLLNLADIPASVDSVKLADLTLEAVAKDWFTPDRNSGANTTSDGPLLVFDGLFFESGLAAHSTSRYGLRLVPGWKQFQTQFALDSNGINSGIGTVVFVVKGDGKELYRSAVVRDNHLHACTLSIEGIQQLELIVEDAGDGTNSDWAVWIEPELLR